MGNAPPIPNLSCNLKFNCCNKDEENMVQPRRSGRFRRSRQVDEKSESREEEDGEMVKRRTGIQSKQADVEEVSDQSI